MKRLTPVVMAFLLGSLLLAGCGGTVLRGVVEEDPGPAPDFTLTDQYGRPFRLSEQKGSVVLLYFGYTFCPDVCPTTLGTWIHVTRLLEEDTDNVRFVFITVDPERDTPERLKTYLEAFHPEFVGLTGSLEKLEAVFAAYGVHYEKEEVADSAAGYLVSHTASVFVIGPEGNWQERFLYGTAADIIAHDIRELLGK